MRLNVLEWSLKGFVSLEARVTAIGKCVSAHLLSVRLIGRKRDSGIRFRILGVCWPSALNPNQLYHVALPIPGAISYSENS